MSLRPAESHIENAQCTRYRQPSKRVNWWLAPKYRQIIQHQQPNKENKRLTDFEFVFCQKRPWEQIFSCRPSLKIVLQPLFSQFEKGEFFREEIYQTIARSEQLDYDNNSTKLKQLSHQ